MNNLDESFGLHEYIAARKKLLEYWLRMNTLISKDLTNYELNMLSWGDKVWYWDMLYRKSKYNLIYSPLWQLDSKLDNNELYSDLHPINRFECYCEMEVLDTWERYFLYSEPMSDSSDGDEEYNQYHIKEAINAKIVASPFERQKYREIRQHYDIIRQDYIDRDIWTTRSSNFISQVNFATLISKLIEACGKDKFWVIIEFFSFHHIPELMDAQPQHDEQEFIDLYSKCRNLPMISSFNQSNEMLEKVSSYESTTFHRFMDIVPSDLIINSILNNRSIAKYEFKKYYNNKAYDINYNLKYMGNIIKSPG